MIMKKNILVVDDSALMRRVICDIINSDDTFQVTDVCRDGLEAYEKLKVNRYDGVILDVNMPRMGGLELLERLQKERIKTNVIMVSTMTTRDADVTIGQNNLYSNVPPTVHKTSCGDVRDYLIPPIGRHPRIAPNNCRSSRHRRDCPSERQIRSAYA